MANLGVVAGDFTQIYNDYKRTVSYEVVTRSTDNMGNETTTFATASNVSVIFFLQDNRYIFDKEGLLSVGDAYIIAPTTTGIKRYDRITIDSQTYYIENTIRRTVLNVAMMDYGVLFKVA